MLGKVPRFADLTTPDNKLRNQAAPFFSTTSTTGHHYAKKPMGLGPSPGMMRGISDACLKEILRVIKAFHPSLPLKIADFVDDLRQAHGNDLERAELEHKVVYDSCTELGILLHNDPRVDPNAKPGKNIPPTGTIDFLGFRRRIRSVHT